MKSFYRVELDLNIFRNELEQLGQLLRNRRSLSEADDILPFFRQRQHLSAFVGSLNPKIFRPDRLAYEYDLFGDFACDMAVGDSVKKSYCFVEFENAASNSIFVSKSGKNTPEWSPRFERGFSQIVDWFWKLDDLERTNDFENRFNGRSIDYLGILIIGRSQNLEPREQKRLKWRQQKLIVNSRQISCITFDELYDDLLFRLNQYQLEPRLDND